MHFIPRGSKDAIFSPFSSLSRITVTAEYALRGDVALGTYKRQTHGMSSVLTACHFIMMLSSNRIFNLRLYLRVLCMLKIFLLLYGDDKI
jgi:hypothetical protein